MYEIGSVAQADVYRAQTTLGQDRIKLIQQRNAVRNSRAALNVTMGRPADAPLDIADIQDVSVSVDYKLEDVVRIALQNNPDIRTLQSQRQAASYGVKAATIKECSHLLETELALFPELRPYLEAVFDQAEEGTEYVITRYRETNINLRTMLLKIIARAGLEPWPKLFQNLRATRETELAEIYPMHVVCAWIGNSQPVAAKHYLQVTEEHFAEAAQNPAQQAHAEGGTGSQEEKPINEKAPVLSLILLNYSETPTRCCRQKSAKYAYQQVYLIFF
jgi:hypothetical protein